MSNALAGTQTTISLGDVLGAVATRVERQFEHLLRDLPNQDSGNRPKTVLQFVHGARQQLLRSAAILYDPRKFMAAQALVEQGGVLDVAATHVRALRQAADELHAAGFQLQWARVPLFNVPDAMDVLATGTYSSFPMDAHPLGGPNQLTDVQQQRLIRQLDHMIYSKLLKAALPEAVRLVKVVGGSAVLRCQGLYEVQLSLRERPYPDQVEEARQQAAEQAAQQLQQQAAEASEGAGTSAAAEAAARQTTDGPQNAPPSAAAEGDAVAKTRWCWTLQYAVLLPNAAQRPPLRPEQMAPFMFHLSRRMDTAADAAAVEAARRQGQQQVTGEIEIAGKAASQSQQQSGPASSGKTSQPIMSGMSAGAVSSVSELSGVSTAGKVDAGRGLNLREYAADENMLPLMIMHGVLRDVAAQVLLNESTAAAKQLAAAGSKWEGHLRLTKAELLMPGLRMHYWQQVPVLMAAQPAASAASSRGSDNPVSFPAVELGAGSDGTVQVMHLPPLRLPGSLHQVTLQLDSHTVDIEGLLLQAVAVTASMHLQLLQKTITQVFRQKGLGQFVQLRLCEFGTEHEAAACADTGQTDVSPTADQEAAAVSFSAPSSSAAAAVPVAMPGSLVVVLNGNALVSVSFQPWSGRIVLRPGSVYGSNRNMEMGIQLHQQQELMQQKQEQYKQRKNVSEQQSAVHCLQELGLMVADVCADLWIKMHLSNFLATARRFSLHHTSHTLSGLYQQHAMLLQLPSAAAAMGQRTAAGAAGPVTIANRHGNTLHLAMPNLQLPPYMMLLARGPWCKGSFGQQAAVGSATAAAAPAEVAALGPVLCMSFPRRRLPGESRDWLLLTLCNAQGLAGPALKSVRIPVSCFPQPTAAAVAAAVAAAPVDRKRKRVDRDQQQAGLVEEAVGVAEQQRQIDQQQQVDQQQQQQQQQPAQSQHAVWLVQPEEQAADLAAAVQWCHSRITFERLLLEMDALQLTYEQVQPVRQQQLQQRVFWQQPAIRLMSIPGIDLFQQLQRTPGCKPSRVGLTEVWFVSGPEYGMWNMQLRGSFYHQTQSQSQQQQRVWQGMLSAVAPGPLSQQLCCYQYDLRSGHDVRSALLELVRVVRMQYFLSKLEAMALGHQHLKVVTVRGGVVWPSKAVSSTDTQVDAIGAAVAAVGNGSAAAEAVGPGISSEAADCADDSPGVRAAKRIKHEHHEQQEQEHKQQALSESVLLDGPFLMNGVGQQQQHQGNKQAVPTSGALTNGSLDSEQKQHHTSAAAAASAAYSQAVQVDSSACGSPHGLLFHWEGTGLVRVAQYSIAAAVLECGAPLKVASTAAKNDVDSVRMETDYQGAGTEQQRRHNQQRLHFAITWQPSLGFDNPRVSSSNRKVTTSSSTTTTWVDVRVGANSNSWPFGSVAQPQDVLAAACSITCNGPHVPLDLLNELSDMADSGCEDTLLDALCVVAWPLAALTQGLALFESSRLQGCSGSQTTAVGAAAGTPLPGVQCISCCNLSSVLHVRYRFIIRDQHEQQQLPQTAGLAPASLAGTSSAAAEEEQVHASGAFVVEMLFAAHGRAKLLISYQPAGSSKQQQQQQQQTTAAGQAKPPAKAQPAVDVPVALTAFYKHMAEVAAGRQSDLPLLPVLRSGRYLTRLPEPQSLSAREGLAGFFVQTQHLGFLLQQLLHFWQQQVLKGLVLPASGSDAVAAGGKPGGDSVVKAEPASTSSLQQQQQQRQQEVLRQNVPVKQEQVVPAKQQQQLVAPAMDGSGAAPVQQQYMTHQHTPSNHVMQQVQQPAAGHVATGI